MKTVLKWGIFTAVCWLMVAGARAAVTNASWTFPTNTVPGPTQPIAADLSIYSTNNTLGWLLFNSSLRVTFVAGIDETSALAFSYFGNHPSYLNGSALTLTTTVSGLATGTWLTNFVLSYDTRWNKTAAITETWSYSVNGGAYISFDAVTVSGNVWQTETIQLSGITLQNGDTITFRSTVSGATGNNGSLAYDRFRFVSDVVPEPSALALGLLGAALAFFARKKGLPWTR